MTRAEAWLTGVGAVLALAPVVLVAVVQLMNEFVVEPAVGVDRQYNVEVFFGALLVSVPGLYLVAALTLPQRRALRAVLATAAALLLLMTSIATYLITLPAAVVVVAAAVVTGRRLSAVDSRELWPAATFVPVTVILWLAAGAVMLDATDSCRSGVRLASDATSSCGAGLSAVEGAAILALAAAPVLLLARLWRSPQRQPQL